MAPGRGGGDACGESAASAPAAAAGANTRVHGLLFWMEALEELAHSLRQRLVERARDGAGAAAGVEAQGAGLVAAAGAGLDPEARDVLTARIVRLATGLGPLEPLLADPSVDEV